MCLSSVIKLYVYAQKCCASTKNFLCEGRVKSFGSVNCGSNGRSWGTGLHK
jgi:hypothetical protein